MENRTQKFNNNPLHYFSAFQLLDQCAALKIERKMLHLNIAFDRFASVGTVMHYILVKSPLFGKKG